MSRWAVPLQDRFPASMWVIVADLRVAGLFLSFLTKPPLCTIVSSPLPPAEFQAAFWSLAGGVPSCAPSTLLSRISLALTLPHGRRPSPLTMRELQGACAVSLGLSNRQIAQALGIAEGTVKNELYGLFQKLHLHSRKQVATAIERAVFPQSPSS
jgi:DNA-binding NarL/FixJ family response regulator